MSLMQVNAHQVEAMVRLAEDLGAKSVKFNIIQPTGRGEKVRLATDGLDVVKLIALERFVDNELTEQTPLHLYFDIPVAFRPLSRIAGNGNGTCGIHGILGVLATGQYALCGVGEQMTELVFGQVGQDALVDVWSSHPVLEQIRAGVPDHLGGVCRQCLMKAQCLGSCVAQNYYRTHDLLAPFWFCEEASQNNIFPQSRLIG